MYLISRLLFVLSMAAAIFSAAALANRFGPALTVLVLLGLAVYLGKRAERSLSAFGTARWANEDDLRRAGMLDGRPGMILGQLNSGWRPSLSDGVGTLLDPTVSSVVACRQFLGALSRWPKSAPPLVKLSNAVHTAVFSPTGGGKGISIALPFLLDCPDSCVVVDFKGELARLTAGFRRKTFGSCIVVLDPFKQVTKTPDTFNPLDFIDRNSETAIDECRDLAESQVIRTGQEREPHWADSSEMWIAAMVAAVVQYGDSDDRSLQSVRDLLSDPRNIEAVIKLLCESDAWGGMLARMGCQLTHFKDKELGSTLTTTNRFLRYLDTLAIAASTRRSSFDPAELCRGKMTIFLVLPPEHARTQSPLLRMWISAMLRSVVRGGLQERNKVHFILDEAASLGHLDSLDDAVDKYRGYGARLMFLYQSLGQLKKCFPEGQDQTFLSNVSQVFFGVSDPQTAEYVSDRLGEETIIVNSGGSSWGESSQYSNQGQGSYSRSRNGSENWQQHGRKLLKPEEVAALHERVAITFTRGVPPICTTLTRYYEGKPLRERMKNGLRTLAASVMLFVCSSTIALNLAKSPARPVVKPFPQPPAVSQPDNSANESNGTGNETDDPVNETNDPVNER